VRLRAGRCEVWLLNNETARAAPDLGRSSQRYEYELATVQPPHRSAPKHALLG